METTNMRSEINYPFEIVHVFNKSDKYHLTRKTLLREKECFFSDILTLSISEFNFMYGSFAFLIYKSQIEANLYLNVNSRALDHIIQYVQTGQINSQSIYQTNPKLIDDMIDLAITFTMTNFATTLRNLHPTESQINHCMEVIEYACSSIPPLLAKFVDSEYSRDYYQSLIRNFLIENKEDIVDKFIKSYFHLDPLTKNLKKFFIDFYSHKLIDNIIKQLNSDDPNNQIKQKNSLIK
jgi:hypothetical protein